MKGTFAMIILSGATDHQACINEAQSQHNAMDHGGLGFWASNLSVDIGMAAT